jgi:micrococcal nuclease
VRILLAGLIIVAVGAGYVAGTSDDDPAAPGRVSRVVDGDTIVVGDEHVRVIGIDTPEIAHDGEPAACYGDEAAAFVREAIAGRRVVLTVGREPRDRFGRLLADVRPQEGPLAGRDLAEVIAERGFARTLAIAPNDHAAATLARLVDDARRARRGLWAACGFAQAFPGRG